MYKGKARRPNWFGRRAGTYAEFMGETTTANPERRLLTIDEAARYVNVSKVSLRRWTNDGRLRCYRVGARQERRFAVHDLESFLDGGARAPGPAALPNDPIAALRAAAGPGAPRHVCTHFASAQQHWSLFRPYVADHLKAGAPIVYIYATHTRAALERRIRAEGYDPEDLARRGLLRLLPASAAYLQTGRFSADWMIGFVESTIREMRAAGHEKQMFSGEMTWYFSGAEGVGEMMAYEARLNGLLEKYPGVTIVCHYATRRFDGDMTLAALCAHPFVQLPGRFQRGFYQA
jgi:excisionase family DNA binding protein